MDSFNTLIVVVFIGIVTIGLLQLFRVEDAFSELYTNYHNIKMQPHLQILMILDL